MKARALLVVVLVIALLVGPTYATHSPPGQGNPGKGHPEENVAPPHPAGACSPPYHVHGAGWDLCWQQDDLRVQGLEINRAYFHNESVIWKMGVPFTLTKYEKSSPGPFKDTLGTPGDAGLSGFGLGSMVIDQEACPRFLSQGELLNENRLCVEHREGVEPAVALWGRYNIFNYRFLQGWIFSSSGEIEPFISLGGHLIEGDFIGAAGQNHYHHLYWRVDFDIAGPGNDRFQVYKNPATVDVDTNLFTGGTPTDLRWTGINNEVKDIYDQQSNGKWRVVDATDLNAMGRAKSYEFLVHSNSPPDTFSTFDVMLLERKGDSEEIGYEVPGTPTAGDEPLNQYLTPPEIVTDPVVWIVQHHYHDTRDEDRGSMTYDHIGFKMKPNNFLDENLGEQTFP